LNLGGFASSFLDNAIADLQAFTKPLQPLANDLETPFIAGSNFTTIWVMQQLGYGQAAGYATTFANTVHAINALTPPVAGTATSVNPRQLLRASAEPDAARDREQHAGKRRSGRFASRQPRDGFRAVAEHPRPPARHR
jgi:hypothetical protein